jgi:AcrR family transcriptional regulator
MNPIHPTRQNLLDHGLRIVAESGLRGLRVRDLAARAGVNLGSFVYHFGNRERYLDELVELWYAPLFEQLKAAPDPDTQHSALERLEATLRSFIRLAVVNAGFFSHLVADALAGERAARAFLLRMPNRHPKLILDLIAEAQAEGALVSGAPVQLMGFVMMSVGAPIMLARGPLRDADWLPPGADQIRQLMSSPQAAEERLAWALRGICTLRTSDRGTP